MRGRAGSVLYHRQEKSHRELRYLGELQDFLTGEFSTDFYKEITSQNMDVAMMWRWRKALTLSVLHALVLHNSIKIES